MSNSLKPPIPAKNERNARIVGLEFLFPPCAGWGKPQAGRAGKRRPEPHVRAAKSACLSPLPVATPAASAPAASPGPFLRPSRALPTPPRGAPGFLTASSLPLSSRHAKPPGSRGPVPGAFVAPAGKA